MELKGKKIAFLGDSITEGVGVADREKNGYPKIMERECELSAVYNYGIGGTRLAHQRTPSDKPRHDLCFCGRAYNVTHDADIIVVYGGINDYLHGDAPFGALGDTTPATFMGGVRFLMNFLRTEFAGKPIVFMSPARLCYQGLDGSTRSTNPKKHETAPALKGYIDGIKETARLFDIPVLDLYEDLGIDPTKKEEREKYTADGLHFNDEGQYFIAAALKKFLISL